LDVLSEFQTQVTGALKAMDSGDNRIDLPYWDDSRGVGEMQFPFLEDVRRGLAHSISFTSDMAH
jgi:hypothetical protein